MSKQFLKILHLKWINSEILMDKTILFTPLIVKLLSTFQLHSLLMFLSQRMEELFQKDLVLVLSLLL